MSAAIKIPVRMTVDEFLDWDSHDGLHYELVDGEPRAMAPANRTHSLLQSRLVQLIGAHLDGRDSPCSAATAPGVVPGILSAYNMRVPDLAVTCSEYEREESALSEPILIVEVLSPSNQSDTWANVWTYTTIPTIREILIVKSAMIGAELLRRRPDGAWPDHTDTIAESEDLVLESIGFRIALTELYRRTRLARK
jgi:Uma2 family endonuclease